MVERDYAMYMFGFFGLFFWALTSISPLIGLSSAWHEPKLLYRVSYYFLVFSHINSVIWLEYGIRIPEVEIIVPAAFQCIISLGSIGTWCVIAEENWKAAVLQYAGIDLVVGTALRPVPIDQVAMVGMLVQLLVYAFQVDNVKPVFQGKNSKYIDVLLLFACFFNSICWTLWSYYSNYAWFGLSSLVGFTFNLWLMMVYLWTEDWIPDWTCRFMVRSKDPDEVKEIDEKTSLYKQYTP